jgi:K(+)-stimulated pyrophosphate-energized sodium pump
VRIVPLSDPALIINRSVGGRMPYLFGAMAMEAVGRVARAVVVEVRRQFKVIPVIVDSRCQGEFSNTHRRSRISQ